MNNNTSCEKIFDPKKIFVRPLRWFPDGKNCKNIDAPYFFPITSKLSIDRTANPVDSVS